MRLSEAIRLGAMLRPQAYGGFYQSFKYPDGSSVVGSCALGAAAEAIGAVAKVCGFGYDHDPLRRIGKNWPSAIGTIAACPCCQDETVALVFAGTRRQFRLRTVVNVISAVSHLNDRHRWSREQIADWVAQQAVDAQESMGVCVSAGVGAGC